MHVLCDKQVPISIVLHFTFSSPRPLFQRVLKMANDHAGYDLKPPGQEGFTIIQYNKEDQYT